LQTSLFIKETNCLNLSFTKKDKERRSKSFDFNGSFKKKFIKKIRNKFAQKYGDKFTIIQDTDIAIDEETDYSENYYGFSLFPNSYFILVFDFILIVSNLYSFIIIPLNAAKNMNLREREALIQEILHYLIDIIFLFDFIIGLFRGYYDFEMNITYMLKKGIKQDASGVYIGEMNSIGFKHGRGVLVDTYNKTFYVGYFLNNEKSGKGVNYNSDGKQQYIGEFKRNKPCGKGEFRYKNGEVLQGTFNSVGEGKGVYTFSDGAYWRGNFYGWTLNGKGTYYTNEGYIVGEKAFDLNKPVEEQKSN